MTGRLLTRRAFPVLVAALSLGLAGTAAAATQVSVLKDGTLNITSGAEANGISVYRISDVQVNGTTQEVMIVRDGDAATLPAPNSLPIPLPSGSFLNPGPGCVQESDRRDDPDPLPGQQTRTVRCTTSGTTAADPDPLGLPRANGAFTKVNADLGDGNDIFNVYTGTADTKGRSVQTFHVPVIATGAGGDDVVIGGPQNDALTGAAGDDDLRGGAGDDVLKPGVGANQVHGGAGTDTLDWSELTNGVAVSLDGEPNDGVGCSLDPNSRNVPDCEPNAGNVRPDVENIKTGSGPDLISATSANNAIDTGAGNDIVYAGGGEDNVAAGEGNNIVYGDRGPFQVPSRGVTLTLPGDGGTDGPDVITAGAGDDLVHAGGGDDDVSVGDGANTVFGNDGNDQIVTGIGADVIEGNAGDDGINAGAGDNRILGGTGNDSIQAAGGADVIDAGDGDDQVAAGDGNNDIQMGAGNDGQVGTAPTAGTGNDKIDGGPGNDVIVDTGGANEVQGGTNITGQDQITTGDGADVIYGGVKGQDHVDDGPDAIVAGGGDDIIVGGRGGDGMDGGAGNDTVSYEEKTEPVYAVVTTTPNANSGTYCDPTVTPPAGRTCEGDRVTNVESLIGGSAGDVLGGDDLTGAGSSRKCVTPATNTFETTLRGGAGDDQLFGCAGKDKLFGDAGSDNLVGGVDGDEIRGGDGGEDCGTSGCPAWSPTGGDSVSYQDSPQGVTVTLGDGVPNDGAPGENDNLFGDIENVTGSEFDDSLTGSGGRNRLDGLGGNDDLDGGAGPDVLIGGAGRDLVTYAGRTIAVRVSLDGVADDGQAGEGDNVDVSVEDATGGAGDDTFVGQLSATVNNGFVDNRFAGRAGNDTYEGGPGADEFVEDPNQGIDTVVYTRPAGEIVTASIDGLPTSGSVNDQNTAGLRDTIEKDIENLTGGPEVDVFTGDADDNVLTGNGGNDQLNGLQGNDRILGGEGDDLLNGGAGQDILQGAAGNDTFFGEGGTDTVDYTDRNAPGRVVRITLDNLANDGEQTLTPPETDNVKSDVERCAGCTEGDGVVPGGTTPSGTTPSGTTPSGTTPSETTPSGTTPAGESSMTTTTVSPVAEQDTRGSSTGTAKQGTAMEAIVRKVGRNVLVRGRILVKARGAQAKASAACKRGGRVMVKVLKGKRVVGKRVAKVSKTCTFRAPVALASNATGKLKVVVRFSGNRALKPTKRTTSLQVNG